MADGSTKVVIVGIGDDGFAGLAEPARAVLRDAGLILGAPAALQVLDEIDAPKEELSADMVEALQQVRAAFDRPRPVIVSTGDPLFYGVARYLCDRLGKDRFEIIPHVSSMQLAFARVKESWDDAYLADLGGRPLETILGRIRHAEKVGLFSSPRCPPARLAEAMLARGLDNFRAYVCEHLGSPDERVTQAGLADLVGMEFDPLHVLILVRRQDRPDEADRSGPRLRFGNPDELFQQSQPRRALVTTAEVRAIALAQLNLNDAAIVWDVGAGSGSISIEAARLAPRGTVFAIEPRAADLAALAENAESFGVANVRPVAGRAPETFADLPDPDAVFVGGTGRHVGAILRAAYLRLKPGGRLAVNVASIEALVDAHRILKSVAGEVQVWNVTVARGVEQLDRLRFQAVNPSFLLAVAKAAEGEASP